MMAMKKLALSISLLCALPGVLCTAKPRLDELVNQIHIGPIAALNETSKEIHSDKYTRTTRTTTTFACSDLQCSGWLYTPKSPVIVAGASKPPVIVMGHGLGGEKTGLDMYASFFASAGFAVFSFDYRYWGQSQGEPRRWIVPSKQVDDWLSAIKHVQSHLNGSVDTSKLSLWGTSFGGGHVITVAAKLGAQIKSAVSQVPHLDGRLASTLSMLNRGALGNAVLAAASLADSAAILANKANLYVPLAGPEGSLALMQLPDDELHAYYDYKRIPHDVTNKTFGANKTVEGELWKYFLTRVSLAAELSTSPYSPIAFASKVTAPLLIVAGKRDALCPFPAAVAAQAKAPNATLLAFDCLHFDIYNPPFLDQARSKELEFLMKYGV